MAAYSMDLRQRVVAACDDGFDTRAEIAERFAVSPAWIRRLLQRRRETGSIAPKPHGGGQPPAFDRAGAVRLRRAVAATPDATLKELARASGVACSTSAVERGLRRLGITRKKTRPAKSAGVVGPPVG
jgi:transposase